MSIVFHEQTVSVLWPFAERNAAGLFNGPRRTPRRTSPRKTATGSPSRNLPARRTACIKCNNSWQRALPGSRRGSRMLAGGGHSIRAPPRAAIWAGAGLAGGRCRASDQAGRNAEHEHGHAEGADAGRDIETDSARKRIAAIYWKPTPCNTDRMGAVAGAEVEPKAAAATDAWVRQQRAGYSPAFQPLAGDSPAPVRTGPGIKVEFAPEPARQRLPNGNPAAVTRRLFEGARRRPPPGRPRQRSALFSSLERARTGADANTRTMNEPEKLIPLHGVCRQLRKATRWRKVATFDC